MHVRAPALAAGVLLLGFCPAVVSGEPITLLGYDRHLFAAALVYGPSGFVAVYDEDRQANQANTASAQAVFGGTTAMAGSQLTSTLSADFHHLSGSSRSSASVAGPVGSGDTLADVSFQFEVHAPHAFEFMADFAKTGLIGGWQAHLTQSFDTPGGQITRFLAISNTGAEQQPRFRGSLDPGRYALFVRVGALGDTVFSNNPTATARGDFTFDLAPVPEPGSMLLVGSGVLGLLVRARRRVLPGCADR